MSNLRFKRYSSSVQVFKKVPHSFCKNNGMLAVDRYNKFNLLHGVTMGTNFTLRIGLEILRHGIFLFIKLCCADPSVCFYLGISQKYYLVLRIG